mmetsp:Transcript_46364/g.75493  ORF Transcript_46364/g.75493 Transcript_46364/m.75493 type:complete len:132 (+) Transcript_46364:400-795(+)
MTRLQAKVWISPGVVSCSIRVQNDMDQECARSQCLGGKPLPETPFTVHLTEFNGGFFIAVSCKLLWPYADAHWWEFIGPNDVQCNSIQPHELYHGGGLNRASRGREGQPRIFVGCSETKIWICICAKAEMI